MMFSILDKYRYCRWQNNLNSRNDVLFKSLFIKKINERLMSVRHTTERSTSARQLVHY